MLPGGVGLILVIQVQTGARLLLSILRWPCWLPPPWPTPCPWWLLIIDAQVSLPYHKGLQLCFKQWEIKNEIRGSGKEFQEMTLVAGGCDNLKIVLSYIVLSFKFKGEYSHDCQAPHAQTLRQARLREEGWWCTGVWGQDLYICDCVET